MYIFAPHLKQNNMIQEKMIHLKEEYQLQYSLEDRVYLCHVAECLDIDEEFQEYLMNNLDDTMINSKYKDKDEARWFVDDIVSRLAWLDKHITLLGSV